MSRYDNPNAPAQDLEFDKGPTNLTSNPRLSPENLNNIQDSLSMLGMTPVWGGVADVANVGISALRGNWGDVGMNLMSAVPVAGQAAGATKLASRGRRLLTDKNQDELIENINTSDSEKFPPIEELEEFSDIDGLYQPTESNTYTPGPENPNDFNIFSLEDWGQAFFGTGQTEFTPMASGPNTRISAVKG
tara:strand:+ start:676 stop:1245 length:570 start_codon:yes stop_codon:yes gene_type:complete